MIWLLWSIIVGWIVFSVFFYSLSSYFGWQWAENFRKDRREERSHTTSSSTNWSFAPGGQTTQRSTTQNKGQINKKVRDYIEQLVSKELGGSPPEVSISTTPTTNTTNHKFLQTYHERLTKTIVDLGKSLHLRPHNYSDNDAKDHPAVETAHDNFCKLLSTIKKEAQEGMMELAHFDDDETVIINNNVISSTGLTNYEEILSNAILNKIVSDVGLGGSRTKSLSPVISVVDSAICKDVKSWVTTTDDFSNFSDDDLSLGTSSSNWSGGDGTQPVVHQIEEHVEITYETNETYSDSSDEEEQDESSPTRQQRPRKSKKVFAKPTNKPVPFPEHGVDMIDSPDEQDEDEPSKKVALTGAWEQNWLFRKKKKPIVFSKMAAESVPMLVPNPSPIQNDDADGGGLNNEETIDEEDKLSDLEDEDFVVEYFELNPNPNEGAVTTTTIITKEAIVPINKEKTTGDSNVVKKTAVDSKRPQDVSLAKKIPRSSVINPDAQSLERKKSAPVFTAIQEIVHVSNKETPVNVHFQLSGHPEPVINIFKGNDILTTIEDRGNGKWTLVLKRDDNKNTKIGGDYLAVATNTEGATRVTFKIQETIEPETAKPNLVIPEDPFRHTSLESQGEDDVSSSSSSSPAEETLKETSQSMVTNETREIQEEDQTKRFSVAEREKMKWANPIKLEFNPYAPENLAKRIRAGRENSREMALGAGNSSDKESTPEPADDVFFKRDIKQKEPKMNVMSKSPIRLLPSDLGGVKLPSVKELAQQFSPAQSDKSPSEHNKPIVPHKEAIRGIQVHSLTARSVSREFREGLKISKVAHNTPQNIIKISNDNDKCNKVDSNGDSKVTTTSNNNVSNENIVI